MRPSSDSKKEMNMKCLMAETHPSEYLLHKYWARKPHNILRQYITRYFKKGDYLVDPFCGSGVFIAEAHKLGIDAAGYDINPIAHLISTVTTQPPDVESFKVAVETLLEHAQEVYQKSYTLNNGSRIRYLVHQMLTKCLNCDIVYSVDSAKKNGSRYSCQKCDSKLSFNKEFCVGTKIVKIYDINNNEITTAEDLSLQQEKSEFFNPIEEFNIPLVTNRRILAFPNMKASDLFTPRAFTLMCDLFESAHKIKDEKTKNAILLLLTSASAQCSRLIPFRNNLKTGGPAWTVPGFWIAPVHLETNPLIHIEARYKKFLKGITELTRQYDSVSSTVVVNNESAISGLEGTEDSSIDGIFFDPPYGDNVPYVEFSTIWNTFLKRKIHYAQEIVVSDRKEYKGTWESYKNDLEIVVHLFFKKLKDKGRVIMTFNNLDPRAWKIVLEAFSSSGFKCIEAKYQIPAVISAKAQMAADTSYVGDYYCVFIKTDLRKAPRKDLVSITEVLKRALEYRNGRAPVNLMHRLAVLMILNENFDIGLIERIEEAVLPIAYKDGNFYVLRENHFGQNATSKLNALIVEIAQRELSAGKQQIQKIYEAILSETEALGGPSMGEIKEALNDCTFFEKNYCYLKSAGINQLSLTM